MGIQTPVPQFRFYRTSSIRIVTNQVHPKISFALDTSCASSVAHIQTFHPAPSICKSQSASPPVHHHKVQGTNPYILDLSLAQFRLQRLYFFPSSTRLPLPWEPLGTCNPCPSRNTHKHEHTHTLIYVPSSNPLSPFDSKHSKLPQTSSYVPPF